MGEYDHFVFMPKGKDTCPRVVIEARLAGMNIHVNENCQHTTDRSSVKRSGFSRSIL